MKNSKEVYYSPFFSHIYIEKQALKHPRTGAILARFPDAEHIVIDHYKDVFCRSGQSFRRQHEAQKLILAVKRGTLVYEGAPVCQSFGNEFFYYTSSVMNCLFDCEYCYLKGMYPSGNIVLFVNLEDIFAETEQILKKHPAYLCVSYDTDLLALENITGYAGAWAEFAGHRENLKIEIRTKSANTAYWDRTEPWPNVVYAFTLSPEKIIEDWEHHAPSLKQRLDNIAKAMEGGFSVRLCFDPMLYCPDWEQHYEQMLLQVSERIDMTKVQDVSVGSFRVSQDYLKKMRKNSPASAVVQFPYRNDGGVYHYPQELTERMEGYLTARLAEQMPAEKIFLWKEV